MGPSEQLLREPERLCRQTGFKSQLHISWLCELEQETQSLLALVFSSNQMGIMKQLCFIKKILIQLWVLR